MTLSAKTVHHRTLRRNFPNTSFQQYQHGVVLIVALVLLIVISLLAVSSMRNAASTERVAGNVRTTELATQAAEIALRYCEDLVLNKSSDIKILSEAKPPNPLKPTSPPYWNKAIAETWDSNSDAVLILPSERVNQINLVITYKRSPECMVESLPVESSTSDFYIVTARGFGPEVVELITAVPPTRIRPVGTEVWMQSHIEISPKR